MFYAFSGTDTIVAGSGNDGIYAGPGADVLTGGTGNDLLAGGDGNDIYRFGLNDGNDTVVERAADNNEDMIDITAAPTSLNFARSASGGDLVMTVGQTTVTFPNYFTANPIAEDIFFNQGGTLFGSFVLTPSSAPNYTGGHFSIGTAAS